MLPTDIKLPKDFSPPKGVEVFDHYSVVNWFVGNIMYIYAKPNVEHTLEEAKLQAKLRADLFKDEKVKMFIDLRDALPIGIEVRNFYSSEESVKHVLGTCSVVNSSFSRVIGNFYFGYLNKKLKTKLVNDPSEGIIWLNQI